MNDHLILVAYVIYLPIALLLTFYVARTLFKQGRVFMLDIFRGRQEIAIATNRLFELGFYLINLGFALLIMRIVYHGNEIGTQDIMEILSYKIGGFSIYLGVMLFLNLYMFFRGRKKSRAPKVMPAPTPST